MVTLLAEPFAKVKGTVVVFERSMETGCGVNCCTGGRDITTNVGEGDSELGFVSSEN